MRIISPFYNDYYDYLSNFYEVEKHEPVWIRKEEEIKDDYTLQLMYNTLNSALPNFKHYNNNYNTLYFKDGYLTLKPSLIIVVGKCYPVIEVIITSNIKDRFNISEIKKYCYTFDEFISIINEYNAKLENSNLYWYLTKYFNLIEIFLNYKEKDTLKLVTGYYTYYYRYNMYDQLIPLLLKNVVLRNYNFQKVKDAETIYREIDMFVNYNFNNENKQIKLSDSELLKKKGFDNKSFKHRK